MKTTILTHKDLNKSNQEVIEQINHKNMLYQYKGGGYDGCIWEWNYCAIIDNKFHDLGSSGSLAIKSEQSLDNYLSNNEENEDYYRYDLDYTSLLTFANCSMPDHVIGVARYLSNHDITVPLICYHCEELIELDQAIPVMPESQGGIVIASTELICHDCYSNHTCYYCGEYYEDLDLLLECHPER